MNDSGLLTGWKMLAYTAGVVLVLGIWLFRLDEVLTRRKPKRRNGRRTMGHPVDGESTFTDPDGTVWRPRKK